MNYGKKGGTSATAGKTAATYEATLPNGRVVRAKSFKVQADAAFLAIYLGTHTGEWHVAGVVEKTTDDGRPIFSGGAVGSGRAIPARRLGS